MRAWLVLLLVSWTAFHAGPSSAAIEPQHWVTANGVRVLFVETHQLPMVQLAVGFDAGSARDPEDKMALAHLVNRMLDQGAGDMDANAVALALDSVGAVYKNDNGRDMSVFEMRTLSDEALLRQATDVFGQILSRPSFTDAALAREKSRLLVNLKQQQQSPRNVVSRLFYKQLFAGHPYAQPPDGEPDGVANVTRADLIAFHRRYFVGRNCIVVLVGDLTRAQAEQVVGRIVGDLPAGRAADRVAPLSAPLSDQQLHVPFPSNQSHLMMGQIGVSHGDADYFPLYVGNHILGGSGLVSRLSNEIREKRGLAYSAYSYFLPMRRRGPYVIGLQTRNDQAEFAEQVTRDTVARFVSDGPTADELDAAKKNLTGGFPLRLDSNQKIAGQLLQIGFYGLPLDYLDRFPQKISAVTLEDVRDAFRRRVDPDRLVRVLVGGDDA